MATRVAKLVGGFNEALLSCVLENQRGLTPKKLLAVAEALELETQPAPFSQSGVVVQSPP